MDASMQLTRQALCRYVAQIAKALRGQRFGPLAAAVQNIDRIF